MGAKPSKKKRKTYPKRHWEHEPDEVEEHR